MMKTIDRDRELATRELLITFVADHPARRRPVIWGASLALAGALAGAGVSTAAFASGIFLTPGDTRPVGQPSPTLPAAIAAPPGITPGETMIVTLGAPRAGAFIDETSFSIVDRPDAATHLRVTVTPGQTTAGGLLLFGTDPAGNNPSLGWGTGEANQPDAVTAWYDFPLDDSVTTFYIESTSAGVATLQYVTHVPTEFAVNASGESFGVSGDPRGEPELIAVVATNGREGFVHRTSLEDANGTSAAREFTSPEDALEWQEENAGVTHLLPVFESDGTTQIGEFTVGQ